MIKAVVLSSVLAGSMFASAALADAAVAHSAMLPSKTGTFVKSDSKSSFTMTVGNKTYLVKINGSSKVLVDHKTANLTQLRAGETLTVQCPAAATLVSP
jgi:hypothetical protein